MTINSHFEYIQAIILKELDETESNIRIAVSWLTDPVLYHKIYSLCRKGKKVEILLNYDDINLSSGLDFEKIQESGGKVFWEYESKKRLMHNKFCLIDDKTIITGSYNWTNRAQINNENIIVIRDDFQNILKFKNEFNKLTNQPDLISTDSFSVKNYTTNGFKNYKSFIEWWKQGYIELRIAISEKLFKRKYIFHSTPSEEDYDYLLSTTALDLEFTGNLLLDYKEAIQEEFNDYDSLQAKYGYNLSSLKGIEHFVHLEYLNCSWNDIVELEPLAYLKKLTYLDLSTNGRLQGLIFNSDMDLEPLKHLEGLVFLDLKSNNNLINFEALHSLKCLRTLDLSETNVTQEEVSKIQNHLPLCEILLDSIEIVEFDEDDDDDFPF